MYQDPGRASSGVESHHIITMQLKHTIAAALSVLLLCVPSWASACELECSLSHSNPASDVARASSDAQPEHAQESTRSSHCGRAAKVKPGSAATHNFESTSKCTNTTCAQPAAVSSPVNAQDGVRMGSGPLSVVAVLPHTDALIAECSSAKSEAARPKVLPPDSLSVSLRI